MQLIHGDLQNKNIKVSKKSMFITTLFKFFIHYKYKSKFNKKYIPVDKDITKISRMSKFVISSHSFPTKFLSVRTVICL